MKLVDNRVRLVMWRGDSRPIEGRVRGRQHAERGFADIWSFSHCRLAVKLRRKEYAFGIWVKQDLLRIKAMNVRNRLAGNRVPVITSVANFAERDAAVPNPA